MGLTAVREIESAANSMINGVRGVGWGRVGQLVTSLRVKRQKATDQKRVA